MEKLIQKIKIYFRTEDKALYCWLTAILLFNLGQSILLPLHFDEAYYWVYSHKLDWGYFDHPPMAALWIRLGSFMPDPLWAIRLVTALTQSIMLWLFWLILPKPPTDRRRQINLYFLIALSLPLLHMVGFITTPDAPLLFFSLLYIGWFARFCQRQSLLNAIVLGVLMALLAYSKYHGAILVLASAVANYKVLRSKAFWLAGLVALLCFSPHLYWQYSHDWASFRFHLSDRSTPFDWADLGNIVASVLGVFNPLLWLPFVKGLRQWRKDALSRTMAVSFFFYVGFVLFSSLKGPAQIQWVIVGSLGYIYIAYLHLSIHLPKQWFRWAMVVVLLLFAAIRIALLSLSELQPRIGFWGNQPHNAEISRLSEGSPVVFDNSYSGASSFIYYMNRSDVHSQARLTIPDDRDFFLRCDQFHYWNNDEPFYGKRVLYITPFGSLSQSLPNGQGFSYSIVDSYVPTHLIQGGFRNHFPSLLSASSALTCEVELHNPYGFDFPLQDGVTQLLLHFGSIGRFSLSTLLQGSVPFIPSGGTLRLVFTLPADLLPVGKGEFFVCVSRPPMGYWYAARSPKVEVR